MQSSVVTCMPAMCWKSGRLGRCLSEVDQTLAATELMFLVGQTGFRGVDHCCFIQMLACWAALTLWLKRGNICASSAAQRSPRCRWVLMLWVGAGSSRGTVSVGRDAQCSQQHRAVYSRTGAWIFPFGGEDGYSLLFDDSKGIRQVDFGTTVGFILQADH